MHEVNICVLNETQNLHLSAERENRNPISRKEREPLNQIGKEIKPNFYVIPDKHRKSKKY